VSISEQSKASHTGLFDILTEHQMERSRYLAY